MSEVVTVTGGVPTLSLNNGGVATYSGGSGSTALTFSYTINPGDDTGDLAVTGTSLNGATVSDGAGNSGQQRPTARQLGQTFGGLSRVTWGRKGRGA